MTNKYFFLAALLFPLFSCEPKGKMISAPEQQTPPYIVDIDYPEPLAEESFDISPKPKPYRPVIVRSMGTDLPHDWETKGTDRKTRVIKYLKGYSPMYVGQGRYLNSVNEYGSCLSLPRQEATGRWRTQKVDGRWYLVDPDGYLNIYRGLTSFQNFVPEETDKVYGSETDWIRITVRQLAAMGFHGVGGFSSDDKVLAYNKTSSYMPLTHTPKPNFLSGAISKGSLATPDNTNCRIGVVFNADFPSACKRFAKEALATYKGNKYILGVMSDNELGLSASGVDVLEEMLSLDDDAFVGKVAAQVLMTDNGLEPTPAAYNSQSAAKKEELQDAFAGQMAEIYYKSVHDAIKEVDPNMLYLGSRLHGKPKTQKSVIESAGRWCDIITINYYGDWTPELKGKVADWQRWTDKPFMITEFYTLSQDVGMENSSGAGFLVKTTLEKGFFYQNFCLALLECPNCVGWTWFRYMDNETSNQGLFTRHLQVYPEFGTLAMELNCNVYDLINYFDN